MTTDHAARRLRRPGGRRSDDCRWLLIGALSIASRSWPRTRHSTRSSDMHVRDTRASSPPAIDGFVPALTAIDQAGCSVEVVEAGREQQVRFREAIAADEAAWQARVALSASGDFLQDWGWASVAAFDREPQRRFVLEEDGEIVAIAAAQQRMIRRGIASGTYPTGPCWTMPTQELASVWRP